MTPKKRKIVRESVPLPAECQNCTKGPLEQLDCLFVAKLSSEQADAPNLPCAETGATASPIIDGTISRPSIFNKRGFRDDWPPVINLRGHKGRRL